MRHGKLYIRLMSTALALIMAAACLPASALPAQAQEAIQERSVSSDLLYNGGFDLPYTSSQTVSGWSLNTGSADHFVTIHSDVFYGDSGNALKIEAYDRSYIYAADFSVEAGSNLPDQEIAQSSVPGTLGRG